MQLRITDPPEKPASDPETVAERRKQNLAKAREVQRKKREAKAVTPPVPAADQNGNGELQEPDFELARFYEMCSALSTDFIVANFPEPRLRDLCQVMVDTLDRAKKRLQYLENQRNAVMCSACKKPLPNGRFAGEIVIRSELTNELEALRACTEVCYREISRIANERRQKHQGSIRGTVAM